MAPGGMRRAVDFADPLWYIFKMLDLDISMFVIFALVWILMLVLDRLFFRPVGRVIHERDERVRSDSERLAALLADSEKKTLAVETRLREARRQAAQAKEGWIRRGESTRADLAGRAREQAAGLLEAKMAELERDIAGAESTLQAEVAAFSGQIRQAFL
jgi:F-type H+-transporting ATPase subunit b